MLNRNLGLCGRQRGEGADHDAAEGMEKRRGDGGDLEGGLENRLVFLVVLKPPPLKLPLRGLCLLRPPPRRPPRPPLLSRWAKLTSVMLIAIKSVNNMTNGVYRIL